MTVSPSPASHGCRARTVEARLGHRSPGVCRRAARKRPSKRSGLTIYPQPWRRAFKVGPHHAPGWATSKLIIHGVLNLPVSMPKREFQNVSCSGIRITPPSDRATKTRPASAIVAGLTDRFMPYGGCGGPDIMSDPMRIRHVSRGRQDNLCSGRHSRTSAGVRHRKSCLLTPGGGIRRRGPVPPTLPE